MLDRVAIVRTDVSEESIASIIRVTRIGELGTYLANLATKARCEETIVCFPLKRRFLQAPHGITFQKTAFFIVTAVETSNLM
jgi:hypothetical protein